MWYCIILDNPNLSSQKKTFAMQILVMWRPSQEDIVWPTHILWHMSIIGRETQDVTLSHDPGYLRYSLSRLRVSPPVLLWLISSSLTSRLVCINTRNKPFLISSSTINLQIQQHFTLHKVKYLRKLDLQSTWTIPGIWNLNFGHGFVKEQVSHCLFRSKRRAQGGLTTLFLSDLGDLLEQPDEGHVSEGLRVLH